MSDTTPFGFGKFVPGFDFLQNLAKGASGSIPQMPNLSNWIAPTISVEELDKRVQELKAVQFWLEQNSRALSATIQALEVQKMTLATLQGMNFSMGDVANAFKLKTADSVLGGVQKISDSLTSAAHSMAAAVHPADAGAKAAAPAAAPAQPEAPAPQSGAAKPGPAKPGAIDPLQWWGALSQQFQHIAGNVLADVAKQTSLDAAKGAASTLAKDAFKTATDMASQMASKGVQSVQEATRAATQLASAAVPAPLPTPPAKKKTTVAKKTTAAKSTSALASAAAAPGAGVKKSAAAKNAAAPAQKTGAPRAPSKAAR